MVLFIILGAVVLITLTVLGFLFYMLEREGQNKDEAKAVPLTDLSQLKQEYPSRMLEPEKSKMASIDLKVGPPFEPKVSLPVQDVRSPLEDDVYKKRAKELEDELRAISHKADNQSGEARQMIESLTKENELLKKQKADLEQAKQKLMELQTEASGLKTDNASLQVQLESANIKVRFLEEEIASFKMQMGEEISKANATVTQLNREKEELLSAPKPSQEEALRQELESLKTEQEQLKQKYEDMDRTYQKLRELNVRLEEKNDLLQYELIKARAQSSGLERVSFNYKTQLEDFFKKINTVQGTNDHLSQVKNRLEGMVEQIKSENEELVKKDQLVQFELEKSRSRLVNLEREYENLKAQISK